MTDPKIIKIIRDEVKKQVNVILSGSAGANSVSAETIDDLYPGYPPMQNRPIMHPFGLSSRAPRGTISVTARQGEHPANRLVLGHRDSARPNVESGEVQLYNQYGQAIYLKNGTVHVGTASANNPAVVGNELKAMLESLIDAIANHTHIGNLGIPTAPPIQAGTFSSIKSSNVSNDKILSQKVFLIKG
jgi:hypothetical protein